MDAIRLGDPNLFVKGVAQFIAYDPTTGNIVGYDNVASDSAITSSVNLQEIAGGFGNALVGIIPDTTRLTGTYTSQAFSFATRKLISGGELAYNGISPVCETITATGASLTVSATPAKHYGQPESDTLAWCYVRESGTPSYMGTNYGIDMATKTVQGLTAITGTSYDVFYFTANASARVLALPSQFNPNLVTVELKYGVYAKQNNAVSGGTFQGWLYVVVPQAILTGNAGLDGNQTTNSTTDNAWMALLPDNTMMDCAACGTDAANLAYYVFVPCAGATSNIEDIAVIGGSPFRISVGESVTLPIKYVMKDGSLLQPDFSQLAVNINAGSDTYVSYANGVLTGVSNTSAGIYAEVGVTVVGSSPVISTTLLVQVNEA